MNDIIKDLLSKARVRMAALVALIILVVVGSVFSCTRKSDQNSSQVEKIQAKKSLYQCPMHPSISSDHPGECPICHMALQRVDEDGASLAASSEGNAPVKKEKKILFYRNPMNPEVTSPTPMKDNMGMDYTPVYEEEAPSTEKESSVQGRASFSLSTERQQLIGVTTTKVTSRNLSYEVRASGTVAFDPELYTAMEEYRQAILSRGQMTEGPLKEQANELASSARTKLKLMGLTDDQIRTLSSGKSSSMNLLLPKGSVWIYAEVYEYELQGLKSGAVLEADVPSIPGKVFTGKVSSISPVVNSPTRTVRVRALVPDPQGVLRPDTYVSVRIKVVIGDRLAIPEDSVLHSGDQSFVFVEKTKGHFEPRAVRLGLKSQSYFEVLSGLNEGETVVTAANFLIDSESRLRGVLQNSQPGSPSSDKKGGK